MQDSRGNTPLHLAAEAGHAPTVRALLPHCPTPRPHNSLLRTPLALALAHGHAPVIAVFVEFLMTPPLPPAADAAAEAAAAPRPRSRAVGGRWARHAMRDDVVEAQTSQMVQEVGVCRDYCPRCDGARAPAGRISLCCWRNIPPHDVAQGHHAMVPALVLCHAVRLQLM